MKAEWLDDTDIHTCLCCGQTVLKARDTPMTPEKCEVAFTILSALGLTREDLLGKHRAQIDYQSPGFAEWLEGQ